MITKVVSCIALIYLIGLPMASQARTIKSITIDYPGMILDDVSDAYLTRECKKFSPTEAQIKHYFAKAHPVSGFILNEDHYSPCFASGDITFGNNKSGRLRMYSGGVAVIHYSSEEQEILYYHNYEWQDPAASIPVNEIQKTSPSTPVH